MAEKQSLYEKLGIDPHKASVRRIFSEVVDNEYPGAFVNIITDPLCETRAMTQHQDGDGSKFIQRLLHFNESGDESIFKGMVDDAVSMNTGDVSACGFVHLPWIITDVLNIGLPKELKNIIMKQIALRMVELIDLYKNYGIKIKFLGGETADLPDQLKTGVFDICLTAWADKKDLILGNVQDGDLIFGFPSDRKASWEDSKNSGIMSNGLTAGRCYLMSEHYNKRYPGHNSHDEFYQGRFDYDDCPELLGGMSVSEALTSPTRQWAIVIKTLVSILKETDSLHMLHGISMNTGGGATKIKNVGQGGILYIKNMPPPPPLFLLIQKENNETWKNMYTSFNCGIGIDVIGENNPIFIESLKQASVECELPLYHLGQCQQIIGGENHPNKIELHTHFGDFEY